MPHRDDSQSEPWSGVDQSLERRRREGRRPHSAVPIHVRGPRSAAEASTPTRPTLDQPESMTIDCAGCVHVDSPVCADCVVTFIVGRDPGDAVVIDADEARAVRLLEQAGLVPGVRHVANVAGP